MSLSMTLPSLADELKPFTSDGCSLFPDGSFTQNTLWLSCCTAHDRAYWQGGTYETRLKADLELKLCVTRLGEPALGKLMLAGVRIGGSPYLPSGFRWGYGWSYPRTYAPLTQSELTRVQNQLLHQGLTVPTLIGKPDLNQ
ncbi:hypothetical protein EKG38_12135 [Shewanella canadensis]|uniref:Uncharacterized protein n=1 Tax=Shewanella canadensis TaxID=271096 RepID=A0A3S0RY09_9GAMM|nr:hypothetical protein [Shewanella canadensis]RTR38965.1 hypothetical protein EKG38_12135 [Shewanella canadensis]